MLRGLKGRNTHIDDCLESIVQMVWHDYESMACLTQLQTREKAQTSPTVAFARAQIQSSSLFTGAPPERSVEPPDRQDLFPAGC
jgi:hypothetical protein